MQAGVYSVSFYLIGYTIHCKNECSHFHFHHMFVKLVTRENGINYKKRKHIFYKFLSPFRSERSLPFLSLTDGKKTYVTFFFCYRCDFFSNWFVGSPCLVLLPEAKSIFVSWRPWDGGVQMEGVGCPFWSEFAVPSASNLGHIADGMWHARGTLVRSSRYALHCSALSLSSYR